MRMNLTQNSTIRREAAEWVATLHAGLPYSPAAALEYESNCREFIEWVNRSAQHTAAFLHADDTFCRVSGLRGRERLNLEDLRQQYTKDLQQRFGLSASTSSRASTWSRRRTWIAVAASVVLMLAGLAVYQMMAPSHEYLTAVGEQLNVKLPDGSLMLLNTKSRARFDFSKEHRFVYLSSGEALFDVERDPKRPFVVITPTAHVRAVGTRFNVYEHPAHSTAQSEATTVSVLEGIVQIAQAQSAIAALTDVPAKAGSTQITPAQSSVPVTRLAAGEQANVSQRGVTRSTTPDVNDAVAWRDRVLVFQGTAIADVAAEFNRYNTSQVLLDDPDIEQIQMTGTYSADHPQILVSYLQEAFPVLITRQGNDWVITKR